LKAEIARDPGRNCLGQGIAHPGAITLGIVKGLAIHCGAAPEEAVKQNAADHQAGLEAEFEAELEAERKSQKVA
jgi:hypothetical protein